MEDKLKLNLTISGVPYVVSAEPCYYNSELQYKVSLNGGEEILFVFDDEIGRYTASGNNSSIVPDEAEMEIGSFLNGDSLKE